MKTLKRMCGILVSVGLVGVICAGTIGIPVLELFYGVELRKYRNELIVIMVGATGYGCIIILSNILTVMHRNRVQLVYFVIISVGVTIISGISVKVSGVMGAVLVYSGSMLISMIVLGIIARKGIKKECSV